MIPRPKTMNIKEINPKNDSKFVRKNFWESPIPTSRASRLGVGLPHYFCLTHFPGGLRRPGPRRYGVVAEIYFADLLDFLVVDTVLHGQKIKTSGKYLKQFTKNNSKIPEHPQTGRRTPIWGISRDF